MIDNVKVEIKPKAKRTRKERIPATVRNFVWKENFGDSSSGLCYCCQKETISISNFHAGHIVSEATGGKVETGNLRPICALCNSSMGRQEMHEFMAKYGFRGPQKSALQSIACKCSIL